MTDLPSGICALTSKKKIHNIKAKYVFFISDYFNGEIIKIGYTPININKSIATYNKYDRKK